MADVAAARQQEQEYLSRSGIGGDFTYADKKEEFETPFMIALFDYGYKLAEHDYPWEMHPPGLDTPMWR